ncbi:MAG: hypothetical protein GX109_01855 [Bacteroidales bacterium]|nr:hypothetical protein [Bacteroidales bacterium]
MSLIVKIIEKCHPGVKGGGETLYSGAIEHRETVTEEEFVNMFMEMTHLSHPQALLCCCNFQVLLSQLLCDSRNVQLSMLGTFYTSLRCKTAKNRKDFRLKNIKSVEVNLLTNNRLKKELLSSLVLKR